MLGRRRSRARLPAAAFMEACSPTTARASIPLDISRGSRGCARRRRRAASSTRASRRSSRPAPVRSCAPRVATSAPGTCSSPPTATPTPLRRGPPADHPDRQLHHRHRAACDLRAADVSPQRRMMSDTRNFLHYGDSHPTDVWSSADGPASRRYRANGPRPSVRGDDRMYPQLAGVRVSHAWSGNVGFTFDQLPHLPRRGITYAMGYCGSGVALAAGWEPLPASGSPGVPSRRLPARFPRVPRLPGAPLVPPSRRCVLLVARSALSRGRPSRLGVTCGPPCRRVAPASSWCHHPPVAAMSLPVLLDVRDGLLMEEAGLVEDRGDDGQGDAEPNADEDRWRFTQSVWLTKWKSSGTIST